MKETMVIELQHEHAVRLLEDLEKMNIINIISSESIKKGLSEEEAKNVAGSIPENRYTEIMSEINSMKTEWERDI